MPDKIKNFFLSFKRFKKPAALTAVLFCIILGLTVPTYSAQAFVQLIGMWVAGCVVGLILQLVLAISNLILGFAGLILSWVLSPYFINIPYTHLTDAAGNITIVGVGWPIVRDFANMFFILILVAIGISTALRIGDYQAKKALPKLIFIALFINFTPVLCGAIIDFCNILMNFFLEELTGLQLMANQFTTQGNMVLQMLTSCLTFGITGMMESIGKTVILMIFDWVAAFIFFMYALLFIMRYVMIWMLVILSPIAFFSMLLSPGIRRRLGLLSWDQWWEQFIEWSIIGILGAFYLYLSEQLLVIFTKVKMTPPNLVGISNWLPSPDWIGEMLSYMVIMAFMIVGFFAATSTSAMGAGFITNAFKKAGTGAAKAVGKGLSSVAKTGATALGYRFLRGPTEAIARRMERTPTGLPGGALIRMAGSQLERFPAFLRDRRTGAIGGAEKEASGKSAEEQAVQFKEAYTRAMATGIGWDKAVGNMRAAIKDGNFGDIQTYLKEKMGVGDEAITDMIRNTGVEAMKSGKHKEILQTGLFKDEEIGEMADRAHLTDADRDVYGLKVSEADRATFGEENTLWKKTMSKVKENQMGNISKPIALSDEFQEVLHRFGHGGQVRGLVDVHGREALDKVREEIIKRQSIDADWYKDANPKMERFLRSSGAQGLGLGLEENTENIDREYGEILSAKSPEKAQEFEASRRELREEFEMMGPSEEELRKQADSKREEIERLREQQELPEEIKEKERQIEEQKKEAEDMGVEIGKGVRGIKIQEKIDAAQREIETLKNRIIIPAADLANIDKIIGRKEGEIDTLTKKIGRKVETRRQKNALEVIAKLESQPTRTAAEQNMLDKLRKRWTTGPAEEALELRTIRQESLPTPGTGAHEEYVAEKAEALAEIESEKKWKGITGMIRKAWTSRKAKEVAEEIVKRREKWKGASPVPGTGAYEEFMKEKMATEEELISRAEEERERIDALRSFRHTDPEILSKVFRRPAASEAEKKAIVQSLAERKMTYFLTQDELKNYQQFVNKGQGVRETDEKMQSKILSDLEKELLGKEGEVKKLESIPLKSAEELLKFNQAKARARELGIEIEKNKRVMEEIKEREEIRRKAKEEPLERWTPPRGWTPPPDWTFGASPPGWKPESPIPSGWKPPAAVAEEIKERAKHEERQRQEQKEEKERQIRRERREEQEKEELRQRTERAKAGTAEERKRAEVKKEAITGRLAPSSRYYELQTEALRPHQELGNQIKAKNTQLEQLKAKAAFLKTADDKLQIKILESEIKETEKKMAEAAKIARQIGEKRFQNVIEGKKKPKTLDEAKTVIGLVRTATELEMKKAAETEGKLKSELEKMEQEGKTTETAYEAAKKQYETTKENREKIEEQLKKTVENLEKFISEKQKKAP